MTREEHISLMIEQLSDPDFMRSSDAGYNLLRHGEYAVQPLIDALPNAKPNVQRIMVGLLRKIGSPAIMPLKQAVTVSSESVCQRMISALADIDDPVVTDVLIELINTENITIKREVIRGLRLRNDPKVIDVLLAELPESDESTRSAITHALAYFGELSVEPVLALLRTDEIKQNKLLLIRLIITLGRLKDERAVADIEPYMNSTHADVRHVARRALRQIGYEEAIS